ncbi:hypothetical protein OIU76_028580 [Salix suchowensis]|nr:hypothetical protein OIU76_028580 [Salix suchowensis]
MGLKGFVEGGVASVIAGASTHPLDLIKVRMQLQGESHVPNLSSVQSCRPAFALSSTATISLPTTLELPAPPRVGPLSIGVRIIQSEGTAALFSGISATLLRQTLYSTTRMGLYDVLKHKWTDPDTNSMPLASKIGAGLISGAVGAAVGNPADVAMVRMQADGRLPVDHRRNYKSVVDALSQMSKQEGVASLWRGLESNGQPCDDCDGVAACIIRPGQGDDPGERSAERRDRHPCCSKFCGWFCGVCCFKPY